MRAAIYCRISRDREGRALGVERQEVECRELAARLGAEVVAVLRDNDLSASTRSRKPRPGYEELLAGARERRWDTILAWSSSRLTRRPLELEGQIQLAEEYGTRYYYVQSPSFNLNTSAGRMVARVLAAADAAEAEATAERLASQKRHAAMAGKWRGGRRPFGYGPDGKTLVPAEAAAIAEATRQLLLGASLNSLAKQWNAAGLWTTAGKPFDAQAVRRIIMRARNAGLVEYRGEVVAEATWPAIVSRAEWEAVCRLLSDPRRRCSTSQARRWLGSRLYRCGVCGAYVRPGSASSSRKYAAPYYRCEDTYRHVSRRADYVDELVEAVVLAYLSRPDVAELLTVRDAGPEAAELEARARELRARLDESADMYASGVWDRARAERIARTVRGELEAVEAELSRAVAPHPAADVATAEDVEAAWRALDLSRRRAIVDALVTVTLLPGRRGRPAGWRPGARYFDPTTVRIEWRQAQPAPLDS